MTDPMLPPPQRPTRSLATSLTFKLFSIGVLIFILLVPAFMLEKLVSERQQRKNKSVKEISDKWGQAQDITGPIISIPFTESSDEVVSKVYQNGHFLPDDLQIKGNINPEARYRGIYQAILYNTKLEVSGSFSLPNFEEWGIKAKNIDWEKATLSVGIPDMQGINESITLSWNDTTRLFEPGVENKDIIKSGVSTRIPLDYKNSTKKYKFSFTIDLNGSQALNFLPLGKETTVSLQSKWTNPSFDGAFLPDSRTITDNGFEATWKVLNLNRNYPQKWKGRSYNIQHSKFGLKLIVLVDQYQKVTRAAKYALMFIGLTFIGFFFVEILNKTKIHPLQYLLVGIALCLFYLLLLSLSEHIAFTTAYLVASMATIVLITGYVSSIVRSRFLTLTMGSTLVILYAFLYSILKMQDYALLMGSIGLFILLGVVMYLSRNIDWYAKE